MTRPFRFGVVATPDGGPERWIATARRVEELGYATLLMPDRAHLLSPFSSLAMAASVTTTLRVGTFVLATPLRTAEQTAHEAHSLSVLSGGRFDMGIGAGVPALAAPEERLGLPLGSPGERLAAVERTVELLRELDGAARTPVLMAAGGPKARAMAGRLADIVTLAALPLATREEMAADAAAVRDSAGARAAELELAMNLFVIGDEVPPWTRGFLGVDAATLVEHDSLVMLRGDVTTMVDELQRRRDAFGVSYISVQGAFFEQLAPVVERLAGK